MATVTKPPILDSTGQDILTQLRRLADAKESNLMGYGGAVYFADLPSPTTTNLNLFYLIKDSFTSDTRFVDGGGVSYPAGKYFCVINIGTDAAPVCKYDELGDLIDISDKQDKTMSSPITVDGVSQTQVEGTLGAINTLAAGNKTNVGTLSSLKTTAQSNLVAAINEVFDNDGGKLPANIGAAHAGKTMVVDATGDIVPSTVTDANVVIAHDTYTTGSYIDISVDLTSGTYTVEVFTTDGKATMIKPKDEAITYNGTLRVLRVNFDIRPAANTEVWIKARKVA